MRELIIATTVLAALLVAAVPALAQAGADQYDLDSPTAEEVSATGTIQRLEAEPVVVDGIQICEHSTHFITDEATGLRYDLMSDAEDLDAYVGQRVTVIGTPLPSPAIGGAGVERCPDLNVTIIAPADDPGGGQPAEETVTATFELAVDCQPSARTGFAASVGEAPLATGALLDQDGNGVYTVSLPVERGTEQGAVIERLDPISADPQAPATASTIKDFGLIEFDEDKTLTASVSFCEGGGSDQYGDGQYDPGSGGLTQLPATGGASLLALGAGALLIGGGLLTRKILR